MTERSVVIAGGGPTGLMLAAELALARVDVVVLERRATQELAGSRAGGLHARTIEILDQRGVAERFLEAGEPAQAAGFALNFLDMSDFPTRHPYALGLFQNQIERLMAEWVLELGVPIEYGREAVDFSQDGDGVEVVVADGERLRAAYLVGCDGGRSRIRRAAGIEFPGWDATTSALIAELEMAEEPRVGSINDELGVRGMNVLADGRTVRVIVTDQEPGAAGDASMEELSKALITAYGTDFGIHSPIWVSRFTDSTRQAASYREGRVLLAGDSAHIHYPTGGQGIQNGIQDAVNLGWKLAQVIQGDGTRAPARHLPGGAPPGDRADAEAHDGADGADAARRHRPARGAPRGHGRGVADGRTAQALRRPASRSWTSATTSARAIHCSAGGCRTWTWRRRDGPLRVYALLHEARPVLLNLGDPGARGDRRLGRPGPARRGSPRGHLGAAGVRRGERPDRGLWSAPTATSPGSARARRRAASPTPSPPGSARRSPPS